MKGPQDNIPHFLVIGAQKSATTWLYYCLKEHPDIYFPPVKEIHYFDRFDRATEYPSFSFLAIESPFKRYNIIGFAKRLFSIVKAQSRLHNFNNLLWNLKFNFGYYNDKWYLSLFKQRSKNQKCGEITPSYSTLNIKDIKKVYRLNPKLKIILMMRNPIDRAWSAFLMELILTGKEYQKVNEREVLSFFKSDSARRRGDYLTIIKNWTSVFPKHQLHIGYYDDVKNRPKKLLTEIFRFIGVTDKIDWTSVPFNKKFIPWDNNTGKKRDMPQKYYQFLYKMYYNDMMSLYDEYDNPIIQKWISK